MSTLRILPLLLLGLPACARSNPTHEPPGATGAAPATSPTHPARSALQAPDPDKPTSAPPTAVQHPASGAPTAGQGGEAFQLGGVSLRLIEQQGACRIVQEGDEPSALALSLSPPCRLHRSVDGTLRVESPHGLPIALIESSRPHPELPKDCDTQLQGVRVIGGRPSVSPHTSRVTSCPPFQWDLKLFSGLFESP